MAAEPRDLDLVLEAEALKREPRRGWLRARVREPESVADHSWRLGLLAMLYAELEGLDAGKAARLALLHDLPEARTGDLTPEEAPRAAKRAREERALRQLLRPLPPLLREEWLALWREYDEGQSPEARLVQELDKLEMAAQALAYERRGEGGGFEGFWATARQAVRAPALRERLAALEARRPQAGSARPARPTARRASSSSGRGSRGSRKRYSRSPRTR